MGTINFEPPFLSLPLGTLLLEKPKYGINAAAVPHSDTLPTYIRITDIDDDGRYSPRASASVNNPDSKNYILDEGDVVLARTGASVGKSYLHTKADGHLVYAGFLIRIKPDKTKLDPYFLFSFLRSDRFRSWVRLMSMRSGQPGINGAEYASLPIPIPNISEQQKISQTLYGLDQNIFSLEKLIAKKRDIKQATMQQLLTGKTRLPGFSGKWTVVPAESIGRFRGGNGFPLAFQGADNGEYSFYKVSDMNLPGNEIYLNESNNYISREIQNKIGATVFPAGTLVFAKVGAAIYLERKKILSKPSCIDNNLAGYMISDSKIDHNYIYIFLLSYRLGGLVSTTALPSLSGSVLNAIRIPMPPTKSEQSAIAEVLMDLESEISMLVTKLDKLKLLKQGMMQELLTGRIRLV